MSEETSTSASSAAGASTEELFNQDTAMTSRNLTQAFPFSSGNPRIEETRGVMHLYRDDIVSSSSDLPVSLDVNYPLDSSDSVFYHHSLRSSRRGK